ncbi:Zinc finger BED domain-containing protein 1 [Merluccius polli]|uniref:Zinc finger BED domain-containing protein 1 n=1 Tax=Merluccius polli TaxID=89951 RepID=A0AA47P8F0_MERPO|nr:Zinc finger BED domain-containing protein 1 [Merluccius polli]
MIAKDLQPFSIVEDEGFRSFVKTLDPQYKIPSRKSITVGRIPALYEECHSKVKQSLDGTNSVVLTTDMWTSQTTEAYLTVSCHIIDENWQMQAYVLETCRFSGQHIADNISSELKRITDEWGISDKVQAVITDNGANMVAAVHRAGWKHYPCFAHTLNLVVKDSIKALPGLLDIQHKCSAIVTFFHHSTRAADKLKEIQKQQNFPEHKLIQSVETRWNSVFYMFERLHEQKDVVTTVLCLLGKSSLCLSEEHWSLISLSVDALRPFEEITREISSEKTCFSVKVSTYLDIRFKSLGFRDMANVEPVKTRLIAEMQLINQTSAPSMSAPPDPNSSSASSMAPATNSCSPAGAAAKGGIWMDFDSQVQASQQHRTAGTDSLIEMRRYTEEKPVLRDQDPLLWWKQNEATFPSLSKLARKHLGVIATSVPSGSSPRQDS